MLDESKVVHCKLVVASRAPAALLDAAEFDPVAGTVEIGAERIASLRLPFGGMFAHAPFLIASSLIQSVVASVGKR